MSKSKERYLTKSRMKIGLECPKKLYYYDDYKNEDSGNEFLEILAEGGYQVGELAKYYYKFHFPEYHYVDITSLGYEESIKATNKALEHRNVVIAEPAITFDNFFIRVDVLVKKGNTIQLVEVKSKSCTSDDEHDFLSFKKSGVSINSTWRPYLADVAFQTYVTSQAFPEWSITPYLMLVNKSKETNMDGLNQLFTIIKTDTENGESRLGVEVNEEEINLNKEKIKDTVLQDVNVKRVVNSILYDQPLGNDNFFDLLNRPLSEFGTDNSSTFIEAAHQLSDAYKNSISLDKSGSDIGACCSKCTFCWQEIIPNYSDEENYISSIWNFPKNKIPELFNENIFSIKDLHNNPKLNPLNPDTKRYKRQSLQIKLSARKNASEWFSDDIFEIMNEWNFPLHFIDFETCTVPLPFHKNEFPYAVIASQYSIHTLFENGDIKHFEWLADKSPIDPTIQFVKELKNILSNDSGTIFMYANHENAVLKSAKQRMLAHKNKFRDEIDFIDSITFTRGEHEPERAMVDMCKFVENNYYHPLTNGSNSLKAVLPAIMSTSKILRQKYSSPLSFGTNLIDYILFKQVNGNVTDPYDILPLLKDLTSQDLDRALFHKDSLKDGSGAMKAFQVLQFSQISETEKKGLRKGLLNYCELDTLAMLMLYEHLISCLKN